MQIDIRDRSEHLFWRAELYLAVQSSRFPSDVFVLLPLNQGDYVGCDSRFVQLPFEVADDDVLLFNLLDNDELSREQEVAVLDACQGAGYVLAVGGAIYQPQLEPLLTPGFMTAGRVLGDFIVMQHENNPFENMGGGEHIVQSARPDAPNKANRVAIYDGNYVRADPRIDYPVD